MSRNRTQVGKKQKRTREPVDSQPKVFHPNNTCSEYSLGETDFLQENVFTTKYKENLAQKNARLATWLANPAVPMAYKLSAACYYQDRITQCHEWIGTSGRRYADDVWKYVIDAIRLYGVDALVLNLYDKQRLKWRSLADMRKDIFESTAIFNAMGKSILEKTSRSPAANVRVDDPLKKSIKLPLLSSLPERTEPQDTGDIGTEPGRDESKTYVDYLHPLAKEREEARLADLQYLDGLGAKICDVLRFWREQIYSGSLKERQQAQKHLKAFGKALIPETRGKRQNRLVASHEVKEFYLKELYRLYHVEHFLRSPAGPKNHSLKVKQASESYGLSIELIREFRGLDGADSRKRGRFTPKDMARELTARKFGNHSPHGFKSSFFLST